MDMMISIREYWIITSLYEKTINLYLYIPPQSTHPPGVLTGLVSGNILRIHSLCIKQDNIDRHMKKFYARLLVRGYQRDLLIPAFSKGITGARAFVKCGSVQLCVSGSSREEIGRASCRERV